MFLHRHDLDGVVSQLPDPGQHLLPEAVVAVDLGLGAAHAHMALVDPQSLWLPRSSVLEGVGGVKSGLSTWLAFLGWSVIHAIELDFVPLLPEEQA